MVPPMPAYTILLMRADVTDRRPVRLNIGTRLFWALLVLAFGAPIVGFMISFGWLAPTWLKLNVENMAEAVEQAEKDLQPLQQQNAELASRIRTLEPQLQAARANLAQAEARATMAETAKNSAAERLAMLEGENINLQRSLATYEQLLKPKLERQLVQCVDLTARVNAQGVTYNTTFTRIDKAKMPPAMTVQVRVLSGDNAVSMEAGANQASTVTHQLDMQRSQRISGTLALPAMAASGKTTRLLDVKVYDGSQTVGYCWKAF
jgi:hypothetical protein